MHAGSHRHRIRHELNAAHFPLGITHEGLAESDSIGDVGEAEDDGTDLQGVARKRNHSVSMHNDNMQEKQG